MEDHDSEQNHGVASEDTIKPLACQLAASSRAEWQWLWFLARPRSLHMAMALLGSSDAAHCRDAERCRRLISTSPVKSSYRSAGRCCLQVKREVRQTVLCLACNFPNDGSHESHAGVVTSDRSCLPRCLEAADAAKVLFECAQNKAGHKIRVACCLRMSSSLLQPVHVMPHALRSKRTCALYSPSVSEVLELQSFRLR